VTWTQQRPSPRHDVASVRLVGTRQPGSAASVLAFVDPRDKMRREFSSNHARRIKGISSRLFLSEHVHVCKIFK